MLSNDEILKRLEGTGTWSIVPNDFPDKMVALQGQIGQDKWLVVEHEPFPGQIGHKGYAGTLAVPPGHMYALTPEIAKAAYLKGKAWLDKTA